MCGDTCAGTDAVACVAEAFRAIVREAGARACPGVCPDRLERRVSGIRKLVDAAAEATGKANCTRKLGAAKRKAAGLERQVARLIKRHRLAPVGRGERLLVQATGLRERVSALREQAVGFCGFGEPPHSSDLGVPP